MSRLLFRDAQGRDGGIELRDQPVYIGRGVDCAIRTDDAMVSRKHSLVVYQDGRYWIEDLDSSNGTHVNDVRVKRQALAHNDVVRCGSLWLRFVEDAPRAGGPGPSTVAFRAQQATATPQQMAEAAAMGGGGMGMGGGMGGNGAPMGMGGGEDPALRAQVAEMQVARDQALAQARYMRDEVVRRVKSMAGELDRMRGELEDLLRKLGG
jgi:predicted component of type VI protein secretion system